MKYVVVTGGVVSGLGKGITASSIGLLLKANGLHVTSIKIDPYLNKDAGTMSPYEHGEVFVLSDGGEADLDLGNYERFLDLTLTQDHNITTGKVYDQVIARERRGDYLGKTVQVVPHVTDAIQNWISKVAQISVEDMNGPVKGDDVQVQPDVCVIELGGTVGDIESMVFLEALRQFQYKVGKDNFCHVHVSLAPVVGAVGEHKSKPTQHSVRELRAAGLSPDIIVCRSSTPLDRSIMEKISMFCMVPASNVVSIHDVPSIYHVPRIMLDQRMPGLILGCLRLNMMPPAGIGAWDELVANEDKIKVQGQQVRIGLVGKYNGLSDSYLSVLKAIHHAAIANGVCDKVIWIDASKLEPQAMEEDPAGYEETWEQLRSVDGVLIPGGFGTRGVEGKVLAANYARENKVPFLGICLGMQVMVIEYTRSKMQWRQSNSTEFDEFTEHPVVLFMPEISPGQMGGTMRLGSRKSLLRKESLVSSLYEGHTEIWERHRHRYEVNPAHIDEIESHGLLFTGKDDSSTRMEAVELPRAEHPFYLGVQFHPEFQSRPLNPSPPFMGLLQAASASISTDHRVGEKRASALSKTRLSKRRRSKALSPPPSVE